VVTAAVSGGNAGARVALDVRVGRRWRTVTAAALRGTRMRLVVRDRGATTFRLRVRSAASGWSVARTVTLRRR
jgi:hypothetical protein